MSRSDMALQTDMYLCYFTIQNLKIMNNSIHFLATVAVLLVCSFQPAIDHSVNRAFEQTSLDSSAFDFWLGKWNATWKDSAGSYHATNIITRKMNGHFIHESFEIINGPNKGYKGESYSTLDKQSGQWKQTWIDNRGAYLDFVGKEEDGIKIFERSFINKAGDTIRQRMRFMNVKKGSFDWDWQSSKNDGEWKLLWALKYTSAK